MEDNKNMNNGTVNETQDEKEQGTNNAPADDNKDEKVGVFKKIGGFFKKNGKKIAIGAGVAAAFAGGIAADRFGLPNFKKGSDDQTGDPDQ